MLDKTVVLRKQIVDTFVILGKRLSSRLIDC